MSEEKKTEKPADPYQRYKDFKWQNPDQFKNGPIDDDSRKCRDCICCFIFIIIFLLCIVVAIFGFKKGKLEKYIQEGLISEKEYHYFCSFPEDRPDPEFVPAFSRTERPPVIRMENECFGPSHSHDSHKTG